MFVKMVCSSYRYYVGYCLFFYVLYIQNTKILETGFFSILCVCVCLSRGSSPAHLGSLETVGSVIEINLHQACWSVGFFPPLYLMKQVDPVSKMSILTMPQRMNNLQHNILIRKISYTIL